MYIQIIALPSSQGIEVHSVLPNLAKLNESRNIPVHSLVSKAEVSVLESAPLKQEINRSLRSTYIPNCACSSGSASGLAVWFGAAVSKRRVVPIDTKQANGVTEPSCASKLFLRDEISASQADSLYSVGSVAQLAQVRSR